MFLHIIHRPVFIYNIVLFLFKTQHFGDGFRLCLQVKPIHVDPIGRDSSE
jgi:hypothetical protein